MHCADHDLHIATHLTPRTYGRVVDGVGHCGAQWAVWPAVWGAGEARRAEEWAKRRLVRGSLTGEPHHV